MKSSQEGVKLSSLFEIQVRDLYQTQVRIFTWFDNILGPLLIVVEIVMLSLLHNSTLSQFYKWAVSLALIIGGCTFYWFWMIDGRLYWRLKQLPMFQSSNEKALLQRKFTIYERLRFIETEQIVFDPVSGREVFFSGPNVLYLIDDLAMDGLFTAGLR